MKNQRRLLGLLPILALAAFGCSSVNSDVMPSKLIVGMECDYQPFNWSTNQESGNTLPISNHSGSYADGYDVQIAKLLGENLGLEVEIVQTSWTSLIPDLQTGSINMIIAGMTDTEERRASISFTDEYYRSELVLVTLASVANQYTSTLDAESFRTLVSNQYIVSQVSTVTDEVIDIFASSYGAIHAPALSTFGLCATDVSNGTAFAMTAELPVAQSLVSSFSNLGIIHIDQNILGETQAELGVSIGVRNGMETFRNALNGALSSISSETRLSLMTSAVSRSGS